MGIERHQGVCCAAVCRPISVSCGFCDQTNCAPSSWRGKFSGLAAGFGEDLFARVLCAKCLLKGGEFLFGLGV